jgi:hypothetical protein
VNGLCAFTLTDLLHMRESSDDRAKLAAFARFRR